jgi:hypothetical protein
VLESTDLDRLYRYADGTRHGTLLDFLNTNQAFTVVPETSGVIYSRPMGGRLGRTRRRRHGRPKTKAQSWSVERTGWPSGPDSVGFF